VVLANYRDFERKMVIGNLAQDVALSVRLAQVYGLNVRGANNADEFNVSYGVHFIQNSNEYYLYKDTDRALNGFVYGNISDKVETYTIGGGYTISDVCAQITVGSEECFSSNAITWLDIAFDRPKPDSIFTSSSGASYGGATIDIKGPSGLIRTVEVLSTGYINVK
jgi:hypothetical protein